MMTNNLKVGTETETKVVNEFAKRNYWAYNFPRNKNGQQPVDVLAIRFTNGSKIWFIDAKHVRTQEVSFSFDRIEDDQLTSMWYVTEIAKFPKDNVGFVIEFDRLGALYWLPYEKYLEMDKNGKKSVNYKELELFLEVLNKYE